MKNIIYKNRNLTPEIKTNPSNSKTTQKSNVAFINKQIFSDQHHLLEYNVKTTPKKTINIEAKKLNDSSNRSKRSEKSQKSDKIKEESTFFKYLLNNVNNRESPEIHLTLETSSNPNTAAKTKYENLLDEMREEKQIFYEKLYKLTSSPIKKEVKSPEIIKTPKEIEKITLVKLIDELEKSISSKEIDLKQLKNKFDKESLELNELKNNQKTQKDGFLNIIQEMERENEIIERQLNKANHNYIDLEKNEKETNDLIYNYKRQIDELNITLKIQEKDYEKEILVLDNNLKKEEAKNIELIRKQTEIESIKKEWEHLEGIGKELIDQINTKNLEKKQLINKKEELAQQINQSKTANQVKVKEINEKITKKQEEIKEKTSETDRLAQEKSLILSNLTNEYKTLEMECKILEKASENVENELNSIIKKSELENKRIESELFETEESNAKKLIEINSQISKTEQETHKLDNDIYNMTKLKETLQAEIIKTSTEYELELKSLEQSNKQLEISNCELQKNCKKALEENKFLENQLEQSFDDEDKKKQEELKIYAKEIEEYNYLLDNLRKSKAKVEEELKESENRIEVEKEKNKLGIKTEKEKKKIIEKLSSELQDLMKVNEENTGLLKRINDEKENLLKELNELEQANSYFQNDMQKNLETINELSETENKLNSKIKELDLELKNKKK